MRVYFNYAAVALAVASLVACGNKDGAAAAAPTQVAAKVGSEEISVHQINQVLGRTNTGSASPQDVQRMSRDVLEKLIDQQLMVDQATETKLNRTPEVVALIESAKREILARAFAHQITTNLPKPSPEDVKKYYTEHPALFAERRIFNVQELVVPTTPEAPSVLDALRGFAAAGKPVEEVAAYLKAKGIAFNGGAASRPAEQVPLELLDKLQPLKDGHCIVLEAQRAVTYVRMANSQSAPMSEANAAPRIEQFLSNQRNGEAIAAAVKQLRSSAKITYMGEFAKALDNAAPAPASTAPASTASPAPTAPTAPTLDKAAMDKGVSGLK
jgi:EpsD family peptidyl-prolyl cis-trans isomerase